jgi:hypothetical protein
MLESKDNCGVCGTPLIYGTESVPRQCVYCGKTFSAQIYCPEGHYVCDFCHRLETLDILKEVIQNYTSTDPIEILEAVMSHPSVPMHGPEHHAIVPVAIITAVKNAGYPIPEKAIEKALARSEKVPGGWCGSHGACGAGIGVGIAISVLTESTPLKGKERSLSNKATASALSKMIDGHPRCCKRASRKAIEAAICFLRDELKISLSRNRPVKCHYPERNAQCPKAGCSYY